VSDTPDPIASFSVLAPAMRLPALVTPSTDTVYCRRTGGGTAARSAWGAVRQHAQRGGRCGSTLSVGGGTAARSARGVVQKHARRVAWGAQQAAALRHAGQPGSVCGLTVAPPSSPVSLAVGAELGKVSGLHDAQPSFFRVNTYCDGGDAREKARSQTGAHTCIVVCSPWRLAPSQAASQGTPAQRRPPACPQPRRLRLWRRLARQSSGAGWTA
jgi:hypothetical protein